MTSPYKSWFPSPLAAVKSETCVEKNLAVTREKEEAA